jgi:hypothetical protein
VKYSKADPSKLQALYDEWKQSGETQKEFLKRKQIRFSVFNNHFHLIKTLSPRKCRSEAMQMLPVKVVQEPVPANPRVSNLLIHLVSGASLHFTTDIPAQYMGHLLSAMESKSTC